MTDPRLARREIQIDEALEFWEPLYGRKLTSEEGVEIIDNVRRLLQDPARGGRPHPRPRPVGSGAVTAHRNSPVSASAYLVTIL